MHPRGPVHHLEACVSANHLLPRRGAHRQPLSSALDGRCIFLYSMTQMFADAVLPAIQKSVSELGVGYLDLYLTVRFTNCSSTRGAHHFGALLPAGHMAWTHSGINADFELGNCSTGPMPWTPHARRRRPHTTNAWATGKGRARFVLVIMPNTIAVIAVHFYSV